MLPPTRSRIPGSVVGSSDALLSKYPELDYAVWYMHIVCNRNAVTTSFAGG